jgi:hypothetical protein
MSNKESYTAEEWQTLTRAPFIASLAIVSGAPSGPLGIMHEATAMAQSMQELIQQSNEPLMAAIGAELKEDPKKMQEELKVNAKSPADVEAQALEALKNASSILAAKATPEEAAAYKKFVMDMGARVAGAAKEGGFMGMGGVQVSDREKAILAELATALGVTAA